MMAEAPHYELISFSLSHSGALGYKNLTIPGFDLPYQLYGELSIAFRDLRYLAFAVSFQGRSSTAMDFQTFSGIRAAVEYRLLSLKQQKQGPKTTDMDCHLEICRLAALICVNLALHAFLPANALMRSLKRHMVSSFEEKEEENAHPAEVSRPSLLLWALFMGGILSLDEREENWFAQRITQHIRATSITTWAQMENWLQEVCWLDRLYTPTCRSLWQKVEDAVAEHRSADVDL